MGNIVIYTPDEVAGYIISIRGKQVILDRDIAALYGVSTKRLNEQVKRNKERFPENFRFQISKEELNELVADCDRFGILKHSSSLPYVFTEQGVAMLSAVLHSDIAVKVSISIMEAFVVMRHDVSSQCSLSKRIDVLELKHLEMRKDLDDIFNRFVKRQIIPVEGVYYDGQIFDAYVFAADLIRSARHTLILIDNYVDDSVLIMLSKRHDGVSAEIRTGRLTESLKQDLAKHNSQYPPILITEAKNIHDRFLIVDEAVYHIGASLKDLGKKLFAFSKLAVPKEKLL
ncbi:MAG: ORF6N domain-containing protein [Bacteroidales bacterium]|nr:ORF6N domain-containing protein [Bacteroidales bacterium]